MKGGQGRGGKGGRRRSMEECEISTWQPLFALHEAPAAPESGFPGKHEAPAGYLPPPEGGMGLLGGAKGFASSSTFAPDRAKEVGERER